MGLTIESENRSVVAPSAKAGHCTPVPPPEITEVLRLCRKTVVVLKEFCCAKFFQ